MRRLIDAESAIQAIAQLMPSPVSADGSSQIDIDNIPACEMCVDAMNVIDEQPTAFDWIPFKMRKPDPDELEGHPDWTYVLDGQLPDNGQRILVNCVCNGYEAVQLDEFYEDFAGCYLDSGLEIGTEVNAWMPLPEPYRKHERTRH